MAKNFAEIAFTESVKAQQEKYGSRRQYARMEQFERGTELSFNEEDFIAEQDGFYLATVGEQDQPYVQFRGGPKGFLKVIDKKTLGYADFRGNLQYISVGNLQKNNRATLILTDYARQARLKIFVTVEVIEAKYNPELTAKLTMPDYQAKIERAMILHVEAFDWNCPQHITPRYTIEQVREMSAPLLEHIEQLEKEIAELKNRQ
jgi:predicted pyridoxine 5'-phosphate oxidase superfamily flavin-nucleotide-binding protein